MDQTIDLSPFAKVADDIGVAFLQYKTAEKAADAAKSSTPYIAGAIVLLIGIWLLRK